MATKQISRHLCRIYLALDNNEWRDAITVATSANTSSRCARAHLATLTASGAVRMQELSPRYLYALEPKPSKTARAFTDSIQAAIAAMKQG